MRGGLIDKKRRFRTSVSWNTNLANSYPHNGQMATRDVCVVRIYIVNVYIYIVLAWASCVVYLMWGKAMREPVFLG